MKRTGFTLIEMLVVIAIITILIAILVSTLRVSKQQARAITCGSNLKQLSVALTLYEQENGKFPYGFDDSPRSTTELPGRYLGGANDKKGQWWFHFLTGAIGENLDERSLIWCPSRCVSDLHVLCGNYGVNRSICKDTADIVGIINSEFVGTPLGLNQIRGPAGTLLLMDSGYSLISWRGASNASRPYFDNPRREGAFYVPGLAINKQRIPEGTISQGFEKDAINGRHPKKTVNAIFTDSHLARLKTDDLFVEGANGSYNNRSPLWLPNK